MNIKSIVIFATGVAAGCAATFLVMKNKYEEIVNEEIQAYKEECKKHAEKVEEPVKETVETQEMSEEERQKEMRKYDEVLKRTNYTTCMEKEPETSRTTSAPEDDPYIIDYEEYGALDDYDTMTLTYFADEVLVDDVEDPIDDIDTLVGLDNLKIFDEEPLCRAIYVRNEVWQTDYEILKDDWNYSDLGDVPAKAETPEKKPHQL